MAGIDINTRLLGTLTINGEDGLYEDYEIPLEDKTLHTSLMFMEDTAHEKFRKVLEDLTDAIPLMYKKARESIEKKKDKSELITYFMSCQLENFDEEELTEIFGTADADSVDGSLFISKLEPRTVSFHVNGDGQIDCVFDFSLPEEYTDELLVVIFDEKFEISDITHES